MQLLGDALARKTSILGLGRWRELSVRSRNVSFAFRGTNSTAAAAREMGVRYIVDGSIRRVGEKTRINVQLSDAPAGRQLWAERFDLDAGDLLRGP